jgi:GlcNAc-P-P-Und epimerase
VTDNIKITITGGSGFIGTNLVEYYNNKRNFEVQNIDIAEPKNKEHFRFWSEADILDNARIEKLIDDFRPHYVVHLAARTDLLETKDLSQYRVNYDGTKNVIDAISKTGTVKRALFPGSMLVCKVGYIPKNETDYGPTTLYGRSKMIMEQLVRNTSQPYSWAIFRPTSIWGPWFGEPYRNFFDLIRQNKYYHIGGKNCYKSFGFVGNTIEQINALLFTEKDIQGKVFYMADYDYYKIKDWANEIAQLSSKRIATLPYPLIKSFAFLGDALKTVGIQFPITSFRLRNMTTEVRMDLSNMKNILPELPYSRMAGNKATIEWLNKHG